jgi:flagellar protein FlbT
MPLKITLKPHEQLILGGAVICNGDTGARLTVKNEVPILREHDILSERETTTPCRRIYFAVQLMYVDEGNLAAHYKLYCSLVRDVATAAPSTARFTDQISRLVMLRKYYPALKIARQLIDYEQELLEHTYDALRRVRKYRESKYVRPPGRGGGADQGGTPAASVSTELGRAGLRPQVE